MWDSYRLSAEGNFSLRKVAIFFAAIIMSALFLALAHSSVTYADTATWDGENIKFGDKVFVKEGGTFPGIGSEYDTYVYKENDQAVVAQVIAVPRSADRAQEIPNVEVREYRVEGGNLYSSPGPPQPLSIAAATQETAAVGTTSCAVEGIGWIICGPSRFIAGGMDMIYEWIKGFLTVKPLTTDTSSGMYQAWEIARGIANLCFILAFLIIIYSQITSFGISNYEIKKMIPRLIIAAILVNVSYYICAIAVDVSNVLGDSVQAAMIQIRDTVSAASSSGGTDWWSWENITEYILSGGTLGVAGAVGFSALVTATGGSAVSLIFLLFPVLIAGVLSVLVALAILAARQAIITVLIVLAPLAFVAFLLPNTEKWFEKWRGLFVTMLLVFPLFSLLFGGSQLASALIIQNADQASVIILALFIQVAPLILTPFLIQFSGKLLGRFAGMINNPNKGLIDRSRNWSKERSDLHAARARSRGEHMADTGINRLKPRRVAFKRDMDRRHRESQKKLYDGQLDSAWANDKREHQLGAQMKYAELRTSTGHAETERAYERQLGANNVWQNTKGRQRIAQEAVKSLQTVENAAWEEAKSNKMQAGNQFAGFSAEAKAVLRSQKIADGKTMFAQSEQSDEWAKLVIGNEGLQARIGGIGGKERALAQSTSEFRKNYGQRIAEGKAVMDHYNLSGAERQAHALGKTIEVDDGYGSLKIFRADSAYTREAAIDTQVRQGTVKEIEEIYKESGTSLRDFRTTIAQATAEAKISQKMVYAGGQTIDMIGQGNIVGDAGLDLMVRNTLLNGKIGAADLASNDAVALERLVRVAQNTTVVPPAQQADFVREVQAAKQAAYEALTNDNLRGSIKKNARVQLNEMIKRAGGTVRDANGNPVIIDTTRDY